MEICDLGGFGEDMVEMVEYLDYLSNGDDDFLS